MNAFQAASVKQYSDEDLMEYFQNGKESAFNELVMRIVCITFYIAIPITIRIVRILYRRLF